MKNKLVSIIIPVYNGEKYLAESLNSVVNQCYDNFEVIIINDGSTDNSEKIITTFSEKYNYIKLISTQNKGVSAARNIGMKEANGDYILFVDSDDIIENNYVITLVNAIEKFDADLSICGCSNFTNYTKPVNKNDSDIFVYSKNETIKNIYNNKKFNVYVTNKMFKKEYITLLNFDEKIKISEDELLLLQYVNKINKSVYVDQILYNYRVNPNSLTHNNSQYNRIGSLYAREKTISIIEENNLMNLYKKKKLDLLKYTIYVYHLINKCNDEKCKKKFGTDETLSFLNKIADKEYLKKLNLKYKIYYFLIKLHII